MHKSHFMSHAKILLPISLEHHHFPGTLVREYSASDGSDAVYSFKPLPPELSNGPLDPWELRQEFLTWPPKDWAIFVDWFGKVGRFGISEKLFAEWQQLIEKALLTPPETWDELKTEFSPQLVDQLFRAPQLRFNWKANPPSVSLNSSEVIEIIIATVQVDALNNERFRVCARQDCNRPPFRVESRRKIYCSPDCAHLVAVRNSRARKAGQAGKPKTDSKNKR